MVLQSVHSIAAHQNRAQSRASNSHAWCLAQILDPVQGVSVMKELQTQTNMWPVTMALARTYSAEKQVSLLGEQPKQATDK